MKSVLKAPGIQLLKLKCDEPLSNFGFNFNLRLYNTALLGGGVYLLGEKATLASGAQALITNNFASIDPDISTRGRGFHSSTSQLNLSRFCHSKDTQITHKVLTSSWKVDECKPLSRGTVGTWADVCKDGSSCEDSSCGTDGDGPIGPLQACGDVTTGSFALIECRDGYVEFTNPPECVSVPAGSKLSRLPSGEITRNAFVCPFGTFSLEAGNGNSSDYSDTCRECPEKALCVGGANAPECLPGTYSIGSGQGITLVPLFSPT